MNINKTNEYSVYLVEYDQQVVEFPVQVAAHSYLAWDRSGRHIDIGHPLQHLSGLF